MTISWVFIIYVDQKVIRDEITGNINNYTAKKLK